MARHCWTGGPGPNSLQAELKERFAQLAADVDVPPLLAVLQLDADAAAAGYARAIRRTCKGVGVAFRSFVLGKNSTSEEAQGALAALNDDESVHGIMILTPLPAQMDESALIDSLDPAKDVDGVHPLNAGPAGRPTNALFCASYPNGRHPTVGGGRHSVQGQESSCDWPQCYRGETHGPAVATAPLYRDNCP